MNLSLSHALQPTFLRDIFQRMTQQGQSMHLICKDEDHRARLLSDIKIAVTDDWQVALISFYTYRESYLNFLEKLAQSLGITERKELTLSLIKKFIEDKPGTTFLLLLDDFEKIANRMDADTRYDGDFVGHLNNMREMPNVRIVITSEKEGRFYWLKKDDDHKIKLSWLFAGLEEMVLPGYSHEEVRQELSRYFSLSPNSVEFIVDKCSIPMRTLNNTIQHLRSLPVPIDEEKISISLSAYLSKQSSKPRNSLERSLINLQYLLEKWKMFNRPALFIVGFIVLFVVFLLANQSLRDAIWNWGKQKILGIDK